MTDQSPGSGGELDVASALAGLVDRGGLTATQHLIAGEVIRLQPLVVPDDPRRAENIMNLATSQGAS